MLENLYVKNVALIDETEVSFKNGLNILTGETGAGKSIIIGSINLALGAKADKGMIRTGAEYALVELTFHVSSPQQREKLKELDIHLEEDHMLVLKRRILPTKTTCKVNGETVSGKALQEIADILIDIHGQHEHQSLLHKAKHFEILDDFASDEISDTKKELQEIYHQYVEETREIEAAKKTDGKKTKEVAMTQFEITEITEAALVLGEDERIEKKYQKMTNSQKIAHAIASAHLSLADPSCDCASTLIGRAVRELKSVQQYDEEIEKICKELSTVENLILDVNRTLSYQQNNLEYDEREYNHLMSRLNLMNHLKSKYGNTIEKILEYLEEKQAYMDKLEHYEVYLTDLYQKHERTEHQLKELCEKASKIRKKNAKVLTKMLEEALQDLNFLDVKFVIDIRQTEEFHHNGYDDVEFLISLNPGEIPRSLGAVASGGELSRIMLALKAVFADRDKIETLIFDEIDTGISGKTAWKVSEKLALLGREHQVICITHLPQIAAMADEHFVIEKTSDVERTSTNIHAIDEEQMIFEIARLLGSDVITDAVIENAKELKKMAMETKMY